MAACVMCTSASKDDTPPLCPCVRGCPDWSFSALAHHDIVCVLCFPHPECACRALWLGWPPAGNETFRSIYPPPCRRSGGEAEGGDAWIRGVAAASSGRPAGRRVVCPLDRQQVDAALDSCALLWCVDKVAGVRGKSESTQAWYAACTRM
ncbi:hypothetical protein PAHAL_5G037200 [Panicum hallii]|jgi:hypothetical protein|uniref:Uncharacterized protein n=1 Tax=Panicum hallii TaxID=206008 RepID=A0A2T8IIS8_9POAL|nr:hypothetical protein PAHAL_5G037200 [Panicum hallii]